MSTAMAFAQYYKRTKEDWAKEAAIKTFENIEKRKANPKGKWTKQVPGTRDFGNFALPMIDINLSMEMKEAIPDLDISERYFHSVF
jgi:N-acylglucosamine 2-epimerase